MMVGAGLIGSDVACGTNYSGDNPNAPENASRRREIMDRMQDESNEAYDDYQHEKAKEDTRRRIEEAEPK